MRRKGRKHRPASSAVLQVAIYMGWGSHAVLPKLACVSMQTQPGRVGRRQNSKDGLLGDGWASAAILVYLLKVIGCCHGRMGGWRFVKGLGSMHCYGL